MGNQAMRSDSDRRVVQAHLRASRIVDEAITATLARAVTGPSRAPESAEAAQKGSYLGCGSELGCSSERRLKDR